MTKTTQAEINNRILKTELIEWRRLEWMQGGLKETAKGSFGRLKTSLRKNSFVQPFNVWEDPEGKLWILDGHHRQKAMQELESDGLTIPEKLPANFIQCSSRKEAAKLVLVYSSIYAKIEAEGLADFISAFDLSLDEFRNEVDFPDVDLDAFELDYINDFATDEDVKVFNAEQIEAAVLEAFPKYKTSEEIVASVITPGMAMGQFNSLCSGKETGYYISALFNPHRFETVTIKSKPVLSAFQESESFWRSGARWIAKQYDGDIHPKDFIKYLAVGIGGIQLANEFKPWIARDLCLRFAPKGGRVLDPCAGWGGRLIGTLSTNLGLHYTAFEPAKKTFSGLQRLAEFLKGSSVQGEVELFNLPFEDSELERYDFAMTSPPYYDTERYSKESTQSYVRYKSFEEWEDKFFRALITKTVEALNPGGRFVLNIGNVRYDLLGSARKICDEAGFVTELLHSYKIGGDGVAERSRTEETDSEPFILIRKEKA